MNPDSNADTSSGAGQGFSEKAGNFCQFRPFDAGLIALFVVFQLKVWLHLPYEELRFPER